jgi:hypothetical protein
MLLTEPEYQLRLTRALRDIKISVVPFHFAEDGAESWTLPS